jgi:hypothetical protein
MANSRPRYIPWDGLHEMVEEYGVLTEPGGDKFRFRVKQCDTPDLVIPPAPNGGVAVASVPTVIQPLSSEDEDDGTSAAELTTAPGDNGSAGAVDPPNGGRNGNIAAASVPSMYQPLSSEDDDRKPAALTPVAVKKEEDQESFSPVPTVDLTSPAGHRVIAAVPTASEDEDDRKLAALSSTAIKQEEDQEPFASVFITDSTNPVGHSVRATVPLVIPTSDRKTDRILGIIECMPLTAEESRIISSKIVEWANNLE